MNASDAVHALVARRAAQGLVRATVQQLSLTDGWAKAQGLECAAEALEGMSAQLRRLAEHHCEAYEAVYVELSHE